MTLQKLQEKQEEQNEQGGQIDDAIFDELVAITQNHIDKNILMVRELTHRNIEIKVLKRMREDDGNEIEKFKKMYDDQKRKVIEIERKQIESLSSNKYKVDEFKKFKKKCDNAYHELSQDDIKKYEKQLIESYTDERKKRTTIL